MYLKQGNPRGGSATGQQADSNGDLIDVINWSNGASNIWKGKFVKVSTAYSGKFWLLNNKKRGESPDHGVEYFPNVWCRHKIELVQSAADAHHSITNFRVPTSDRGFRFNFSTMDSYDVCKQNKGKDSADKWI
ncbi:MAG: hypothetical protein ACI87E_001397 [Mariniblastus sp.]|jgi:hypothetical protein